MILSSFRPLLLAAFMQPVLFIYISYLSPALEYFAIVHIPVQ